jgi:hypothetical protein
MPAWPDGHSFAFTIVDDTDWVTIDTVKPVYELLHSAGMRTTKLVWMLRGEAEGVNSGSTCEDPAYLDWVLSLQKQGFEIGLHNAAPCTSKRPAIETALDRFEELFGAEMLIHCNHTGCLDNIYWGDYRLSGWRRSAYCALTRGRRRAISRGHVPANPLFWGDLCRDYVLYVRNFVFDGLNTLAMCPEMPYHDPEKPYVNFWFAAADGGNLVTFLKNFTQEKIDEMIRQGGLCIAYVHFAGGFTSKGRVHPEFRKRIEYIASKNGWFVPVSVALDYLRGNRSPEERAITPAALDRLEARWLRNKVAVESLKKIGKTVWGAPQIVW